ncbi:unnamed protein product [Polarella glacialis]|uniref:Methyltransferase FkbM domain-containing protein n=1 Tax=Polarella glacialis TaxID=89957 RepID=A0A813H5C5_POLGL|nr:unnamed protein product [Polarella glacialis]
MARACSGSVFPLLASVGLAGKKFDGFQVLLDARCIDVLLCVISWSMLQPWQIPDVQGDSFSHKTLLKSFCNSMGAFGLALSTSEPHARKKRFPWVSRCSKGAAVVAGEKEVGRAVGHGAQASAADGGSMLPHIRQASRGLLCLCTLASLPAALTVESAQGDGGRLCLFDSQRPDIQLLSELDSYESEGKVTPHDLQVISRDLPVTSRDLPVTSRDFPVMPRDLSVISQWSQARNWKLPVIPGGLTDETGAAKLDARWKPTGDARQSTHRSAVHSTNSDCLRSKSRAKYTSQVFVDAGANIGGFTLPLAKHLGAAGQATREGFSEQMVFVAQIAATVHAFEPFRLLFQCLNANVMLNGLSNVYTYQVGLGNKSEVVRRRQPALNSISNPSKMHVAETVANTMMVRTDPSTGEGDYVRVQRLDEIEFGDRGPDFIKVDVESMEMPMLQGSEEVLRRFRPSLYVEDSEMADNPVRTQVMSFLQERRYLLVDLVASGFSDATSSLYVPEERKKEMLGRLYDIDWDSK